MNPLVVIPIEGIGKLGGNQKKKTIVTYGDSWTYGSVADGWQASIEAGRNPSLVVGSWVSQLTRWLGHTHPQYAVCNQGKPGWSSVKGRECFDELVCSLKPDVLILNFGINDWRAGVVPSAYGSNIEEMILDVKRMNGDCILWTSGPVSAITGETYGWNDPLQDQHFPYHFDDYNHTLRQLAVKHGLILADIEQEIIKEWRNGLALSEHFYDAIHFSQWGHDYIFECMKSAMLKYHNL